MNMNLNVKETNGQIIVEDQDSFDPQMIFECGQAFNWTAEDDGSYTTVAFGRILNVKKDQDQLIFSNTSISDFEDYWIDYFDLKTDYRPIKDRVRIDEVMAKAIDYGYGIRILNQEPFETIISFIISANNRIPMIKRSISLISQHYGDFIGTYRDKDYYSFPTIETLAQARPEDLREIARVGFRDKRIVQTSLMIRDWNRDLKDLYKMEREELKSLLMELPGVGPKVSDCIILFAFKDKSAFPVDVWIKRVVESLYLDGQTLANKEVANFGRSKFGQYAGVAQQYLFYYGRENKIGTEM